MIKNSRIGIIHLTLAAFALAVIAKSAKVQLVQGSMWAAEARSQHFTQHDVPALRGDILDAAGRTLAESRDMVQIAVAPQEARAPRAIADALTRAGVDPKWIARATDTTRKWVGIPDLFRAADVAALTAMRGVYTDPVADRVYPGSDATRRIVGRVDATGRPLDGIELALDSLLRGHDGAAAMVRDGAGKSFASPTAPGVAPREGNTVVLTLNADLQQIAERALDDAVSKMGADGGDIVILDPSSGEVLAMASRRLDPRSTSATALTEPFEPGSTMKPLIAAALLTRGLVHTIDSVATFGGQLTINGRTIHDDREEGLEPTYLSLADVIRRSSNVGIVQFAERLSASQEYQALRDFGLGTPTEVAYPSESDGTLRPPKQWSSQSANSMAMGYEIAVTPLQLATAYAAIANGGELLLPSIVKEIRSPDGTVLYMHMRRVVRRVMPPNVAAQVRQMLLGVVENGTAVRADLANYLLGGKTGTPRRTVNGRYAPHAYTPNFVGLFPGNAPQFVIVVKLDNPQGAYYSASTAAPLTKTILQAALAARDAALNRTELMNDVVTRTPDAADGRPRVTLGAVADGDSIAAASRAESSAARAAAASVLDDSVPPVMIALPAPPIAAAPALAPRAVPNVAGLTLRDAVRSLHDAGFRVELVRGAPAETSPAAGAMAAAGATVRLRYGY
ncbi:MAG TPA: penicillin-binding transpeptidase domain-containing protein [Gemmatimonadaceae bacterium]